MHDHMVTRKMTKDEQSWNPTIVIWALVLLAIAVVAVAS